MSFKIDEKPPIEPINGQSSTITLEEPKPIKGAPLSQVFNKDTLTPSALSIPGNEAKPLPLAPELLPPILPLDPSFSNVSSLPPRKKVNLNQLFIPPEVSEALSLMKEKTIESILRIVFMAQLQLEKENAHVTEGTISKYLFFQKLQNEVLEKIKDALIQDENVAERLKTGQNIALAASMVSGVAALAIQYGLLGPVAGFIGTALGASLQTAFVTAANFMGGIGPLISAGLTATTTGAQLYYERQTNLHNADHEIHKHRNRYLDDLLEYATNNMTKILENRHVWQETWLRALKRLNTLRKLITEK